MPRRVMPTDTNREGIGHAKRVMRVAAGVLAATRGFRNRRRLFAVLTAHGVVQGIAVQEPSDNAQRQTILQKRIAVLDALFERAWCDSYAGGELVTNFPLEASEGELFTRPHHLISERVQKLSLIAAPFINRAFRDATRRMVHKPKLCVHDALRRTHEEALTALRRDPDAFPAIKEGVHEGLRIWGSDEFIQKNELGSVAQALRTHSSNNALAWALVSTFARPAVAYAHNDVVIVAKEERTTYEAMIAATLARNDRHRKRKDFIVASNRFFDNQQHLYHLFSEGADSVVMPRSGRWGHDMFDGMKHRMMVVLLPLVYSGP